MGAWRPLTRRTGQPKNQGCGAGAAEKWHGFAPLRWGVIKVSIFSFPIFVVFSELLVNSVLFPAIKNAESNYFPSFNMGKVITYFPRIETRKVIKIHVFETTET